MSEREETIFFGLEIRPQFKEKVSIPLHHSFTCSITGAGKSVTERTLISRTDAKFLIIDCKTPRDYEGVGPDIPIFIDDRSDPLMIKRLLESSSRLWLRKEFPELIELSKVGKTWEGVLEATRQKMKWVHPKTGRGVHPVVKERLVVLEHLLGRLIDEMKSIKIVDTLKLPHKINVVDIHGLSLGLQQLVVHSVLAKVLKEFTNVVVVIDEAHRFCPERKPSAARDAVTLLIQEGRAKNDFVWMSDQTVTGVDKDVLKQMHVWILGCQTEKNEADRTLDQLTHDMGLKRRDIYKLKTGHFLVNTREWTKLAYLVPEGMDLELAEEVISGRIKPEDAFTRLQKKREVDQDLVWRERYEEERRKREELEKEFSRQVERLSDLKAEEKAKKIREEKERLEVSVAQQKAIMEDVKKQFDEAQKVKSRVAELENEVARLKRDAEAIQKVREALRELLPVPTAPGFEPGSPVPSEIAVVTEQPALTVEVVRKPLTLNEGNLEGRIAIVYAEGSLPADKSFTARQLNSIMEQRFGRKEFPGNLSPACNKFVAWGFFEKIRAGKRWDYRVKMKPQEAKEKGLLNITELKEES